MRFYCVTQGTISSLLEQTVMEDNMRKEMYICFIFQTTYSYEYRWILLGGGAHPWRMEFPKPGTECEQQL